MRKLIILLFLIINIYTFAQAPKIVWQETFGSVNDDAFYTIVNTHGSYVLGGVFRDINDNSQSWLVNISDFGIDFWQKKFIWKNDNLISAISMNSDLTYTVVGYTYEIPRHRRDIFFMRLNTQGGNKGKKVVGGFDKDGATSVLSLPDGGNIIYGYFTNNKSQNLWALRVNKYNTQYWKKEYNYSNSDEPTVALLSADKKIILTSNLYNTQSHWDACFTLLNYETGSVIDTFTIGNIYNNKINDALISQDSNIVACGYTELQDKAKDFWVVKVSTSGNVIWEKNFGWSMNEEANAIYERSNGNLLVCGYTESKGNGMYDFWIIELDTEGNQIWEKTIGTDANDIAYDLCETDDGSIIVVGSIFNGNNKLDGCVLKLQ